MGEPDTFEFPAASGEICQGPGAETGHVQESIYDKFMERALKRVQAITRGHPLDPSTMLGAQASQEQVEKILSYIDIGKQEGAELLTGGAKGKRDGDLAGGFYIEPTVFRGNNKMRIFQEEIFGPVLSVATFKTEEEAIALSNDTLYGLGAGGVDPRRLARLPDGPRAEGGAGVDELLHLYPAHAAFGGYKQSGIGRKIIA